MIIRTIWLIAAFLSVLILTGFCHLAVRSNSVGFEHALFYPFGVIHGLLGAVMYRVLGRRV